MSTDDNPTLNTENLASSLAENLIISSTEEEKSLTNNLPSNIDIECDNKPSENKDFYLIKWIEFNYEQLPILLQNVNGPCPLLAIVNILLLRKRVKLSSLTLHSSFLSYRLSLIPTKMR